MPARQSYKPYTVVAGDTLAKIAARFGSSVTAIATASGVADPNKITVGQQLLVPTNMAEDELAPIKVTAQLRPVTSAPKADPRAAAEVDIPTISLAEYIRPWFEPPRLWGTLALLAAAGYYLLSDNPRRKR